MGGTRFSFLVFDSVEKCAREPWWWPRLRVGAWRGEAGARHPAYKRILDSIPSSVMQALKKRI